MGMKPGKSVSKVLAHAHMHTPLTEQMAIVAMGLGWLHFAGPHPTHAVRLRSEWG